MNFLYGLKHKLYMQVLSGKYLSTLCFYYFSFSEMNLITLLVLFH